MGCLEGETENMGLRFCGYLQQTKGERFNSQGFAFSTWELWSNWDAG